MLIIYLGIIGIGLVAFIVVFLKELKNDSGERSAKLGDLLTPSLPKTKPSPQLPAKKRLPFWVPKMPSLKKAQAVDKNAVQLKEDVKEDKSPAFDKIDQKYLKLEQLLDEKNQLLDSLQKDLESERSHRGEFEALKGILQQQIDDLKLQNRNLKDEMEKILQDSLRLQSGLPVVSPQSGPVPQKDSPPLVPVQPNPLAVDFIRAEPEDEIIPAPFNKPLIYDDGKKDVRTASPKKDSEIKTPPSPSHGIGLHDVFGDEEKENK